MVDFASYVAKQAQAYTIESVLLYTMSCANMALRVPHNVTEWRDTRLELQHELFSVSTLKQNNAGPEGSESRKGKGVGNSSEICLRWNSGECIRGSGNGKCNRAHKCSNCSGEHKAKSCPKQK